MVKREELLELLKRKSSQDLIQFVQQCKAEGASCLAETVGSCSKKQLDHVWEGIFNIFSQKLLMLPEEMESDEGSQSLKVIQCVTCLLAAMLAQKDVHVPETMVQIASLLQNLVPTLPVSTDKIKYSLTRVFEDWWKKGLPNKESLVMTSFISIVERSLDLTPKPLVADVKRVWSLHEVILLVELHNESSTEFKTLLLRCYMSPQYMQLDEGIRFLGYVMTLDEDLTDMVHTTIKNNLLLVPRSWHERYGEIYFRAWQTGALTQKLEQGCLQDLMYHAVHAQSVLAPALKKLLSYIHGQKKHRGVDDMLCRQYEPIIWRSLRVANSRVRANSAALFFDVFPLQSQELPVQQSDALLQKQFDLFQELLDDPFPNIRSASVIGVFRIMHKYWQMIPQDTLKDLTVKLVQGMLNDTSSADVRESVIKGIAILLDNHLCHLFLKPVLPEIRNSFHDVSEKVRVAMLELLKKVKSLRTIKYWNIVPIEHLLARLVVDSDPVNKRIMKLIFGSFVPIEASSEDQLERCIALIQSNSAAARQFFRYAPEYMNIQDTVSYITMLCKAVLAAIQKSGSIQNRNDSSQENLSDGSLDVVDDEMRVSNTPLMKSFCEAMCILWTISENQLKKASNAHLNKTLQKKFSYALPEMIKHFSDPEIVCVLVQIAAFLPLNYIPTLSRTWLPKLRNMVSGTGEEEYATLLESLCKNGRAPDIIEMIVDWLSPVFVSQSVNTSVKKPKKRVGFVEPKEPQPQLGLDMLSYLLRDSVTQDILLRDHLPDVNTAKNVLQHSLGKMERLLTGQEKADPELLTTAFTLYCKLSLLLHTKVGSNKRDHESVPELKDILGWTDKHMLPVLGVKCEPGASLDAERNRKLAYNVTCAVLNIFNNMMLIGSGDCSLCNILIEFCTSCLVVDEELELLPLVMLCLYQVTEFLQYLPDTETEINNTIPNALSRILVIIAGFVKHNRAQSQKLLGNVKVHLGELMRVVFDRLSLNESLLNNVMATILAAILAELDYYSQDEDLAEEACIGTLPPLSGWLLDILIKKKSIFRYFLDELTDCCESGAISGVHKIHGAVHILNSIAAGQKKDSGLNELWTVIQRQLEATKLELNEEQSDSYRTVILSVEAKLQTCQQLLNIVES